MGFNFDLADKWYKCPICKNDLPYNISPCPKCKSELGWKGQTIDSIPYFIRTFTIEVKGESLRNDDGTSRQNIIRRCQVGESIKLVHEPHPKDKNAVKICRLNGEQLGYIPKIASAEFATVIKRGIKQDVVVSEIKDGEYTGCWLKVTRYSDDLSWNEKVALKNEQENKQETVIGQEEQQAPIVNRAGGGIICPTCGNILAKGVKKCPKCGYKIPPSKKLTLIVTIAVLLIIGSFTICMMKTTNNTNSPVTQDVPQNPPAAQKPATFDPITLRGTDSETTSPFAITTNEWIIDWSYSTDDPEYAVFGFFIYPRGETERYAEAVLFPKITNGTTYSYAGPGEYYIKTTVGNITQWEITIRPAE
jgi:hypothetical protein